MKTYILIKNIERTHDNVIKMKNELPNLLKDLGLNDSIPFKALEDAITISCSDYEAEDKLIGNLKKATINVNNGKLLISRVQFYIDVFRGSLELWCSIYNRMINDAGTKKDLLEKEDHDEFVTLFSKMRYEINKTRVENGKEKIELIDLVHRFATL